MFNDFFLDLNAKIRKIEFNNFFVFSNYKYRLHKIFLGILGVFPMSAIHFQFFENSYFWIISQFSIIHQLTSLSYLQKFFHLKSYLGFEFTEFHRSWFHLISSMVASASLPLFIHRLTSSSYL